MNSIFSINWLLLASAWYFVNGVFHDIFVIKNHKGGYDRELLRLLMDGHVLLLSGILLFISWMMLRQGIVWGTVIGFVVGISMIVYCAMIFPFLKSFVTLLISIALCITCAVLYLRMPH